MNNSIKDKQNIKEFKPPYKKILNNNNYQNYNNLNSIDASEKYNSKKPSLYDNENYIYNVNYKNNIENNDKNFESLTRDYNCYNIECSYTKKTTPISTICNYNNFNDNFNN